MPSKIAIFEPQVPDPTTRTNKKTGARQSAVAAAAYRAGENIKDELTGTTHYYAGRKGVDKSVILAPDDAPEWVQDRGALWNNHEAKEIRKDARIFKEIRLALPLAFETDDNVDMTLEWVKSAVIDAYKGIIADVSFHDMDRGNPHAHIMLTQREFNEDQTGFGNKVRSWDKVGSNTALLPKEIREELGIKFTSQVDEWRTSWEIQVNNYLEHFGFEERVSKEKNSTAEDIATLENENLPQAAYHMEAKGEATRAREEQAAIKSRNKLRRQAAMFEDQLEEINEVDDHYGFIEKIGRYWDNFQKRMIDDLNFDDSLPNWAINHALITQSIEQDRGVELE